MRGGPYEDGAPVTTLLQDLAVTCARPVPAALRPRAARHLLDWLACAVAGAVSEPGRIARATLADDGPAPLAGGGRASPRTAALVNGTLGNALEMDDVHRTAILHPGPVVIPAALALGADADALLDAIVRGYEAMIRVGQAVGPAHYARFHNTATCGPFGSAAAAASALALEEATAVHALANAGSTAGGLWQMRHEDTHTKQLHAGRAAEAGVTAALLAAEGFRGPVSLLEGPQGFLAGLCPDGDAGPIAAAYEGWLIEAVSFKPWPACRHAHPAIDAALAIRDRVPWDELERVRITTYRDARTFCDRPDPAAPAEARFSLQHAVAVTLLRGPPDLDAFGPEAIADPDVAALRARCDVRVAPHMTAAFPEHYRAEVSALGALYAADPDRHRAGGVPVLASARADDALGDPDRPLTDDHLRAKAVMLLTAGGYGDAAAERLCGATLALGEGGDLAAWSALVAEGP